MIKQTFEEWLATDGKGLAPSTNSPTALALRAKLKEAWEAGYAAGKQQGEWDEVDRQDTLNSLG